VERTVQLTDVAACSWADPILQSNCAEANRKSKLLQKSLPFWWQAGSGSAQGIG